MIKKTTFLCQVHLKKCLFLKKKKKKNRYIQSDFSHRNKKVSLPQFLETLRNMRYILSNKEGVRFLYFVFFLLLYSFHYFKFYFFLFFLFLLYCYLSILVPYHCYNDAIFM